MNNKYLDKVVDYIVRDTIMDYDDKRIVFSWIPESSPLVSIQFDFFKIMTYTKHFITYCRNQFGLNDEEIKYVWNQYRNIINDKIENEE